MIADSVNLMHLCPLVTRHDEQLEMVAPAEEDVDPKMALIGEPIVEWII